MAEKNAKLELPEPEKLKKRGRRRMLALLCGLGLLVCAAAYGALMYYSVQTPNAMIESNLLGLGTQVSAQVTEVLVKKNERVQAGQALIRLNSRTQVSNNTEARAQVASVRNLLPPPTGMEDVARRVADAQAAEQDLVNRITQARALEDEAARDVQRKSEEHARSQLELRRLDVLSKQYSVPRAQHDQARNDEHAARQNLEKARATREEQSRARAATEGELNRIKTELAELKTTDGQARGMPGHVHKTASAPSSSSSAPDSLDISAPTDAIVADVFVQPGKWVKPDEQIIALMPDADVLEATAWFPEKDGVNIQPGQICRVFVLELPGKSFSGKVKQVLPADSASKFPFAAPVQARQIPVRISFSAEGSGYELKHGMRAAVRVHLLTPPWMRTGVLAEKTGGGKTGSKK